MPLKDIYRQRITNRIYIVTTSTANIEKEEPHMWDLGIELCAEDLNTQIDPDRTH